MRLEHNMVECRNMNVNGLHREDCEGYSSVVKTLPGQARHPGFNTQELSAFTSLSVTTKMSVNVLSGESPVPC